MPTCVPNDRRLIARSRLAFAGSVWLHQSAEDPVKVFSLAAGPRQGRCRPGGDRRSPGVLAGGLPSARPVSIGTPGCSANPAEPDLLGPLRRANHRCAARTMRFATSRTPSARTHPRREHRHPVYGARDAGLAEHAVDHPVRLVEDLCAGPPDNHEAALLDPELAGLLAHDPRVRAVACRRTRQDF